MQLLTIVIMAFHWTDTSFESLKAKNGPVKSDVINVSCIHIYDAIKKEINQTSSTDAL